MYIVHHTAPGDKTASHYGPFPTRDAANEYGRLCNGALGGEHIVKGLIIPYGTRIEYHRKEG